MPDPETFSECEELTDDRPIRQGDVFAWLDAGGDAWRTLGVIVTANCDIAQQKHRGILSYVPILRLDDYLRLFYLPKRLEKALRPVIGELTKTMRVHQAANRPDFPEALSDAAAQAWARDRDAGEIADDLRILDAKSRAAFTDLVREYQAMHKALQGELYAEQVDTLIQLRVRRQGITPEKARDTTFQEIHDSAETLPGDCFFIGRIGSEHSVGYVAYLRLVREIQHNQMAVKQTDFRTGAPVLARRISRLRSPYIYRLTQQLADVFLAIGLPGEYEDHRRRVIASFTAKTNTEPSAG